MRAAFPETISENKVLNDYEQAPGPGRWLFDLFVQMKKGKSAEGTLHCSYVAVEGRLRCPGLLILRLGTLECPSQVWDSEWDDKGHGRQHTEFEF